MSPFWSISLFWIATLALVIVAVELKLDVAANVPSGGAVSSVARSAHSNQTCWASFATPACASRSANRTPVQRALPTAPSSHCVPELLASP